VVVLGTNPGLNLGVNPEVTLGFDSSIWRTVFTYNDLAIQQVAIKH